MEQIWTASALYSRDRSGGLLALLVSHNRKQIRIRYVIQLLVIEVLLAWFFLNSDIGLGFVKGFSEMFEKLLGFANEGTNFVFGNMTTKAWRSSS